jgi:hypothetical protein
MISQLQTNLPVLIASFERLTTVYVKQYGPGNLRICSNREDLTNTVGATVQDGIAQATANGWQQYFWEGDLWLISDQAGAVVIILPSYQFYIDRGLHGSSPNVGVATPGANNLSTYANSKRGR